MTSDMQFESNSGHSITLTNEEWVGLQSVAQRFNLSVSEMLGRLGRGQLVVTDSLEVNKTLDAVVVIEGVEDAKEEETIFWEAIRKEEGDAIDYTSNKANPMSTSNSIRLEKMRVKIFDTQAPGSEIGSSYRFLLGLVEQYPKYEADEILQTVAAANTEAELIPLQQKWNDFLESLEMMGI
jgi:hypothetical protein